MSCPDQQGSWGAFVQGGEQFELLDRMGAELSKHIGCPVHYPAYNKRLFECHCLIPFPVFAVEGAYTTGDWSQIVERHQQGL